MSLRGCCVSIGVYRAIGPWAGYTGCLISFKDSKGRKPQENSPLALGFVKQASQTQLKPLASSPKSFTLNKVLVRGWVYFPSYLMVTQTQGAISPWAKWPHCHSPFQVIWWGIRQVGASTTWTEFASLSPFLVSMGHGSTVGGAAVVLCHFLWLSLRDKGSFLCNLKDKATRLDSPRSILTEPALL